MKTHKRFRLSEPIQSVQPRIERTEKFRVAFTQVEDAISLLCPVMSYPMASYR